VGLRPVVVLLNSGGVVIKVRSRSILCSLISECRLSNIQGARTSRFNLGRVPCILRRGPGGLLLDVHFDWSFPGGWILGDQVCHRIVIGLVSRAPDVVLGRNCRLLGNKIVEGRGVASSNALSSIANLIQ
jgi:hypothetical protein